MNAAPDCACTSCKSSFFYQAVINPLGCVVLLLIGFFRIFIPFVGIIFYFFFGQNTRKERLISDRSMDQLTKRSMLEFVEQENLQHARP